MSLWSRTRSALRNLFHGRQQDELLDAELRATLDLLVDERIAAGMSPAEARRTALAEFGGTEQVKQAVRDLRAGAGVDRLWQDTRFGWRQVRRHPGFSLTVILTLALAVGANTAIFSVVNALLLETPPYPHPERLGTVFTRIEGPVFSDERHHINGEQWELLRDQVPSVIAAVSSIRSSGVNLRAGSHLKYTQAARVSASYLDVLGIRPPLGRGFVPADDEPNGPKSVILSYSLWRTTFDADPHILGHAVLLKGEPFTVIGVLPPGATTPQNADLYIPLRPTRDGEGGGTNYELITRLRDGATWQQADAEINRTWQHRSSQYELKEHPGARISYRSVPFQQGSTAELRPQVLGLMLAAAFILLIACANLAALTLVRVRRRLSEIATRLALGASHWQIERQLWIENLLLAALGGAAGIVTGFVALRGLLLLLPEHFLPIPDVRLDLRVLAFSLLAALLTSVLFGMLPALAIRHLDLRSTMAHRTATNHLGWRQGLIAGEVALTIVLLAAAGLFVRTLIHLETLPPGFDPAGVITARASLDDARLHDAAKFRTLLTESVAAMRRIPGVEDAAVGLSLPYERSLIMGGIALDGKQAGQTAVADEVYVTPGYFATLRIPLLAGRGFTEADGPLTQKVAIVNRTFARKFFGSASPVGRYLNKDMRVVGVVEAVSMAPGVDPVAPLTGEEAIYVPAAQMEGAQLGFVHLWFQPSWIVRTTRPLESVAGPMQQALASADPNLPFSGFYSMRDLLAKTLVTQRLQVTLLGVMASLALVLSAIGIFALIANTVAEKSREIGIRMALGSPVSRAMVHVGAPGVRASALGAVLGLALCAATLRTLRTLLYGVQVYDPGTLVAVLLLLGATVLAAAILPTLRIAGIDPARTLREE